MTTRRKFIRHAAAIAAAASVPFARAAEPMGARSEKEPRATGTESSGSPRIKSLISRPETLIELGGDCACWGYTWAADDRQYGAALDGPGLPEIPQDDDYPTSALIAVGGDSPYSATFEPVRGYPHISMWDQTNLSRPGYYGFSTLAVGDHIYHFLSTRKFTVTPTPDKCPLIVNCLPLPWNCAKLIYSPDNGQTWRNQDGSSPVVLDSWDRLTPQHMVFAEPDQAFGIPTFLQMGKAYSENEDGYVYVYGTNGVTEGTQNQLVMFRVPKGKVTDRTAYEYFAGRLPTGDARWTKDIKRRGVVHTFPSGYVSHQDLTPFPLHRGGSSWDAQVIYNAPLKTYMLFSGGTASDWWSEGQKVMPTYSGAWVSAKPWGPWSQIYEDIHEWNSPNNPKRLPLGSIPPKWIAADGKSYWVAAGGGGAQVGIKESVWDSTLGTTEHHSKESLFRGRLRWRLYHPHAVFAFQRVDIVVA